MYQFFSRFLIGYLFIVIDLQIGIDWLPDIIGFVVIAFAIQNYANSKYNKTAIRLSWLVGILSIFQMPLLESLFNGLPPEFSLSYEFLISFFNLLFYYYIFGVCISFTEQTPYLEYTKRVKNWVIGSMWFLMTASYILVHNDWIVFNSIFLIAALILFISIIRFIVYCYKMMKYGKMIESEEAPSFNMNLEPIAEHK